MKKACFILGILTLLSTEPCCAEEAIDKEFIAVSTYLVVSTVFDIETTFAAIRNGAHELNPLMKPFVKNRVYMYSAQLSIDVLIIWLSYEMKKSKKGKSIWWIAPAVIGTTHGVCGGLNLRCIW